MTNYLETREVLKRLNIEIFELFDLCKNGKLQAYNTYGKKIVDPDLCEKGKKDSFKEVLRLVELEEGTKKTGTVIYRGFHRGNIEKPLTREEQERKARKQYNYQPDSPIIPKNCVLFNFSFPARPSEYQTFRYVQNISKQKIKEAELFLFKKSDVKRLEIEHGIEDKPKSMQSVDEFVRSLTIYPENDDTINIRAPRRQAEKVSGNSLCFRKIPGKQWKLLQDIIKEGQYYIGSDSYRKRLEAVEEKLIKWLNTHFNAKIPSNCKLFERAHEHKKGTWKPKFKTQPAAKYSGLTKEQILNKIEVEWNKNKPNQETINDLVLAAREKGASDSELTDIINTEHKNTGSYNYIKDGGHITNKP